MEVEQQVARAARQEDVQEAQPRAEHATAASGRTPRDSPSASATRAVRERVAITTHSEENSVVRMARAKDIGTTRRSRAPERAPAGATSTFSEMAETGTPQSMRVRKGRSAAEHQARAPSKSLERMVSALSAFSA